MKKIFAVLLGCTLIFILIGPVPAVAQEREEITGEARTEAKPKRKSYKGTIEAIDVAARTITVKKAASRKTFTVAPETPIRTVQKEYGTLEDLKEGELINVRFTVEGEANVATRITHAAEMKKELDDAE
jgi:hypothetical protein